eukprot:g25065.t1
MPQWGFNREAQRPVVHFDAGPVSSAGSRVAWPNWLGRSGFPTSKDARERNEETERDRKIKQKVMEGIMVELRREVDRLEEDAWMFKKLPF